jgi:hypothetical protein
MVHQTKRWIRLAVVLALVLAGVLVTAPAARAQGILYGSTIPAGSTIEDDAILWGDTVTVDGTVNGDVFAFGRTIKINGKVTGSVITGGQTIDVEGEVGGSVYSVGLYLGLGPEAVVGRTAYLIGLRVATQPGSTVERDLSVLALSAQFHGAVGRESRAVVGLLEFIEIFTQSVDWQRGQIQVHATSLPQAAIPQAGPARFVRAALGPMPAVHAAGDTLVLADEAQAAGEENAAAPLEWFLGRLRELVILFVVGALALWLFPSALECWAERLRARPLPAAGYGLVSYIGGFAGSALLAVLLFATGLALALATFGRAAFFVWGLGYSALGLVFLIFLLLVLYGSKAIVAYLIGSLILDRWPRVARHRILPMLLGVVLFVLLRSIPILGWVIGVVVTLMGLGAVWMGGWKPCQDDKGQEIEVKVPAPGTAVAPQTAVAPEAVEAVEAVEPAEPAEPVEDSD